jgi:hypothetical protein
MSGLAIFLHGIPKRPDKISKYHENNISPFHLRQIFIPATHEGNEKS